MRIIFTATFLILLFGKPGFSQTSPFSKDQQLKFEKQSKVYLEGFIKTIKALSDPTPGCDKQCLDDKIYGTLKNFKEDAIIQTITLKNPKPKDWTVNNYLKNIVKNYSIRFDLVIIKFENIVINDKSLTEIKRPNGSIEYEMTGNFRQTFCAKSKQDAKESNSMEIDAMTICEYTDKEFKITLRKQKRVLGPETWVVLLSNIYVRSITNLKD